MNTFRISGPSLIKFNDLEVIKNQLTLLLMR